MIDEIFLEKMAIAVRTYNFLIITKEKETIEPEILAQLKEQTQYGIDAKLEQVLGFYEHELGAMNVEQLGQWSAHFELTANFSKNDNDISELLVKVFNGETIKEFDYFSLPAGMTPEAYLKI